MGTQFWWFFDVAAAAIMLIHVYSCGKKGFVRIIALLTGYALSIAAATAISDMAADYIYEKSVKQHNIDKIEQLLDENSITRKTENLLEEMGYENLTDSQIAAILVQDVTAGMNTVKIVDGLLSEHLRFYAPDESSELLQKIGTDGFEELMGLMQTGSGREAAEYIEENYTGAVSRNIIKIICFIIILFVLTAIVRRITKPLNAKYQNHSIGELANHALGGVFGAAEGFFTVFLLAGAVRILIALSSDEMLFFNSSVIDKTIIFKHIYKLTVML